MHPERTDNVDCSAAEVDQVAEKLRESGLKVESAEVAMLPQNFVMLEGKSAQQMLKLIGALDELDDIRHVWSNFDIDDKEIEASLA